MTDEDFGLAAELYHARDSRRGGNEPPCADPDVMDSADKVLMKCFPLYNQNRQQTAEYHHWFSRIVRTVKVEAKKREPALYRKCVLCATPLTSRQKKFCGRACSVSARRKPRPRCPTCGGWVKRPKHGYCSDRCVQGVAA